MAHLKLMDITERPPLCSLINTAEYQEVVDITDSILRTSKFI